MQRQFVIGMAGHIDHGKTALVEALTGINTDRLKEEKERGITVDLGFAHFSENVTIIDVPGHERLIKNMVAGVTTIDLVLFVVAADDGIMPQTREHLEIVNLLGINNGIFVITKTDLADQDWVSLVEEELRELIKNTNFANAPILKVSALKKAGIEQLRNSIKQQLEKIKARRDDGIFRLPVDRVFSKAGFGSIVTGSVISGKIGTGDSVEVLPEKLTARIRGLQSHDSPVERVEVGFRAALNLTGVDYQQLYRGQVLILPGFYQAVDQFNAKFSLLDSAPISIKNQARVRIHLHTMEVLARVILLEVKEILPGDTTMAQFRFEKPIYASYGDRFIIRQYSPQVTLGGGIVLETNPPKFRKKYLGLIKAKLTGLQSDSPSERIISAFSLIEMKPLSLNEIRVQTGFDEQTVRKTLSELEGRKDIFQVRRAGELFYLSKPQKEKILEEIKNTLEKFHRQFPGRSGKRQNEVKFELQKYFPPEAIETVISVGVHEKILRQEGDSLSLPDFQSDLSDSQQMQLQKLEDIFKDNLFTPPLPDDARETLKLKDKDFRELLTILRERGNLVMVEEKILFHQNAIDKIVEILQNYFRKESEIRAGEFKDLIGSTRKYAIPLLTFLDDKGYTIRQGDIRIKGPGLD
ncbi:MAG: selenocysteine-specific translation elongation factor [Calditrichota bacterium]|jgi:selenocysteine-specific elongation factor